MTEEQARESGADIQVVTLPVAAIPRARVMNDTRGVLKAIVDNKTQRILGASLLCVDSHEMINIVKMVMDAGLPYSILRDQIFTHPSMSESLNDLFSLVNETQNQTPEQIFWRLREKNLINSLLLYNFLITSLMVFYMFKNLFYLQHYYLALWHFPPMQMIK